MVRARLAAFALAISLASGCASHDNECSSNGNSGWFSRFRLASRTNGHPPCECTEGAMLAKGDGVVIPPNAFVPPPNTFVGPSPAAVTNPPAGSVPPRIIPIPQANPTPYSPQ